jgi:hypothetical protein
MTFTGNVTFNLTVAIFACSFIFAYLGIMLNEKHIPLKILFILLAVFLAIANIGNTIFILKDNCTAGTGVCTDTENDVVDTSRILWISLLTAFLLILGYFIVFFINWILWTLRNNKVLWKEKMDRQSNGEEEDE